MRQRVFMLSLVLLAVCALDCVTVDAQWRHQNGGEQQQDDNTNNWPQWGREPHSTGSDDRPNGRNTWGRPESSTTITPTSTPSPSPISTTLAPVIETPTATTSTPVTTAAATSPASTLSPSATTSSSETSDPTTTTTVTTTAPITSTDDSAGSAPHSFSSSSSSSSSSVRLNSFRWLEGTRGIGAVVADVNSSVGVSLGVLIAPRFVVTNAVWLSTDLLRSNDSLRVVFASEQIVVRRMYLEASSATVEAGVIEAGTDEASTFDELIVLELDHDAEQTEPYKLLSATPQLGFPYTKLSVQLFDSALATPSGKDEGDQSNQLVQVVALDSFSELNACGMNTTAEDYKYNESQMLCTEISSSEDTNTSSPTSLRVAVLTYDDYLVGISSPSSVDDGNAVTSSADTAAAIYSLFTRLGSSKHRHFLDSVVGSNSSIDWHEADEFAIEKQQQLAFPQFIATFADSNSKTQPKFSCSGVLIAPTVVLTTATCALERTSQSVIFHRFNRDDVRIPILKNKTIIHPKFVDSSSTQVYDVALVILATRMLVVAPLLLNTETLDVGTPLLSFNISRYASTVEENWSIPLEIASDQSCSSLLASPNYTEGYVCKREICAHTSSAMYGFPIVRASKNSRDGFILVGLTVSLGDTASGADLYLTIAALANFINAYIPGQPWNQAGKGEEGNSGSYNMNHDPTYKVPGGSQTENNATASPVPSSSSSSSSSMLPANKRFIVGLRITKDGQNFCGGSLIAPDYVLTAAHCVADGLANYVSIGSKESAGEDTEPIAIVQETIHIHPKYGKPYSYSFDAAILELKVPAYAKPVKLDKSVDFVHNETATMYGYGVTSPNSDVLSPVVRVVPDLPLYSRAACDVALPDVDNSVLCAGGESHKDACTGDSGGPLVLSSYSGYMQRSEGDEDILVGFVSAGYGCGQANIPGIYMRVSALASFIDAYTIGQEWTSSSSTGNNSPTVTPAPDTNDDGNDISSSSSAEAENRDSQPGPSSTTPKDRDTDTDTSGYDASMQAVDLLPETLQPFFRRILMLFLVGEDAANTLGTSSFMEQLLHGANRLRFYSSGNLTEVMNIITEHNVKPLYKRDDRFGRLEQGIDYDKDLYQCNTDATT